MTFFFLFSLPFPLKTVYARVFIFYSIFHIKNEALEIGICTDCIFTETIYARKFGAISIFHIMDRFEKGEKRLC